MVQGALQHMGEPELQHWMHMACCRALATSAQAVQQLIQQHGQRPTGQKLPVQVLLCGHGLSVHTDSDVVAVEWLVSQNTNIVIVRISYIPNLDCLHIHIRVSLAG